MSKKMKSILTRITPILVLLSSGHYVNTDRIDYIDSKGKWIKIGNDNYGIIKHWYLNVTDLDIEQLKKAMGVYGE